MQKLLNHISEKLSDQGLCEKGSPVIGFLDTRIIWNRSDSLCDGLETFLVGLGINSILFSKPKEPYFSILNFLAKSAIDLGYDAIYPQDCETKTFMHQIPVLEKFDSRKILEVLRIKGSVFIIDHGIISSGMISPRQAFVWYSSICFAGFVKFFVDCLYSKSAGTLVDGQRKILNNALKIYGDFIRGNFELEKGPFLRASDVESNMVKAAKALVQCGMVDSFFGNISYRLNDKIFISQTSSCLDELSGYIDECPLDGSSCVGITASSEYTAHKNIYLKTDNIAILHGHPKFSVIMSMFCDDKKCLDRGECEIKCKRKRFISDIPIVCGCVGTGEYGLCNTLPSAIEGKSATIVYGHGLFAVGKYDFTDAFCNMVDVEKMCVRKFVDLING